MKNGITRSEGAPPVEVAEDDETFDADGALSRGFLLRRGFCCKNGCKNCPYGFHETKPVGEKGEA